MGHGSSNTMGVRTERLEVGISVSPSLDRRVVSASCLVQAQTPVTPPHVFLFLGFNPYPSPTGGMLPSPQNHSCWRPSAASVAAFRHDTKPASPSGFPPLHAFSSPITVDTRDKRARTPS